jgi:hypothetical protein
VPKSQVSYMFFDDGNPSKRGTVPTGRTMVWMPVFTGMITSGPARVSPANQFTVLRSSFTLVRCHSLEEGNLVGAGSPRPNYGLDARLLGHDSSESPQRCELRREIIVLSSAIIVVECHSLEEGNLVGAGSPRPNYGLDIRLLGRDVVGSCACVASEPVHSS